MIKSLKSLQKIYKKLGVLLNFHRVSLCNLLDLFLLHIDGFLVITKSVKPFKSRGFWELVYGLHFYRVLHFVAEGSQLIDFYCVENLFEELIKLLMKSHEINISR